MEDHHEFEKAVFEFRHKKLRSSRVFRNRKKKKNRLGVSMNHYEAIYCYYALRVNPKKTQKSPHDDRLLGTRKRMKKKKPLIRCGECEKGFRYEKCLLKHHQVMHSEESTRKDLFCSFSGVQRRKRSKRVSRYKKTLRISVSSSSSSSTNFPACEDDDGELLEVAETLILLSKSVGEAPVSKVGFLRNEQKRILEVGLERVSLEDRLQNAEERLLGLQETAFEDSDSGKEGFEMNNNDHRCRICDRVFTTYQALGGHQTFHRNKFDKSKLEEMQRRLPRS